MYVGGVTGAKWLEKLVKFQVSQKRVAGIVREFFDHGKSEWRRSRNQVEKRYLMPYSFQTAGRLLTTYRDSDSDNQTTRTSHEDSIELVQGLNPRFSSGISFQCCNLFKCG